ncbi:MAG: type II toxin-antitoxin system HicA family toxin [Ignavibacteriales bacterium]|nr:type II toxin-antitoxin system HicA family toxin [Ignavibacteriales bacterium]
MKRRDFVRELERNGCPLKRHGSNPDIYFNPNSKKSAPVPRHSEIPDSLCALIRKQLEIKKRE